MTRKGREPRRHAVGEEQCGLRSVAGSMGIDEPAHAERAGAGGHGHAQAIADAGAEAALDDDLAASRGAVPSTSAYGVSFRLDQPWPSDRLTPTAVSS